MKSMQQNVGRAKSIQKGFVTVQTTEPSMGHTMRKSLLLNENTHTHTILSLSLALYTTSVFTLILQYGTMHLFLKRN